MKSQIMLAFGVLFLIPVYALAESQPLQLRAYEIKVEEVKAQTTLVIKGKTTLSDVGVAIGKNIQAVASYLEKIKVAPAGKPFTRTFGLKDNIISFEAGFPVPVGTTGQQEIVATELPQATAATTLHIGAHEDSEKAYQAIHEWMQKNGRVEAGAPWEVYLTDPETTPTDKNQTKIFYPVK